MAGQSVRIMGVVEGSIPVVSSAGTATTADVYTVEVTTAGPSGTAKITVTSRLGDNLAANTITSGVAENLGTKGATFTAVFEELHLGDRWTVQTLATGEVLDPVAVTTNYAGSIVPVRVTPEGEIVTSVELEASDIEIGAVELKNGATDDRALISAANTARAVGNMTLLVQAVDAAGAVLATSGLATSAKQPALGQALEAACTPVVLPAAQVTTLTPPAAITGFATETTLGTLALESGGNLDAIVTALGSPAQAGEAASATAGLALDATLGSPAQAGEAASATSALALESGGNLDDIATDLAAIETLLGSPAQAGEAASATSALALESGGVLDDIAADLSDIKAALDPQASAHAWAQMTEGGYSATYDAGRLNTVHLFKLIVALNGSTNLTVRIYGNIEDSTATAYQMHSVLIEGDGTVAISSSGLDLNAAARYVWVRFGTETGGTDATLDASYMGAR